MPDVTMGTVTAKTVADNSQFDATMKATEEKYGATTRANKKAAELQAKAIAFAAKFSADVVGEQNLRIVAALKVQSAAMADMTKANRFAKDGYGEAGQAADLQAKALARLTAAKLEVAAASKVEAAAETEAHKVSDRMAASAVVRGLETGNVGIRAVENFLTKVAPAGLLQGAFSVIGPIAFTAAVAEGGVKLYEMEQKGKHAGEEINRAFGEMNTKLGISNDDIALSNSRLEDMYGRLTKHPTDGLKTAILEAVSAADKLQESLGNDLKALNELLKTHDVSVMEGLLSGVSSTGGKHGVNKEIEDVSKEAERQGFLAQKAYAVAMSAAGKDRNKQEDATKAYYQRMDDIAAAAARQMRKRATEIAAQQAELDRQHATAAKFSTTGTTGAALDLTPIRSAFEGAAETFDKVQLRAQLSGINFADEKKVGSAKQGVADDSAQHKAAEAQMKAMEDLLADERKTHRVSVSEEQEFWETMAAVAARYPENLEKVNAKIGELNQERIRQQDEWNHQREEAAKRILEQNKRDFEELTAFAQKLDEADERRADGASKLVAANQKNVDAMAALTDAHDVATGAMSRHDAAMREATRHAADYRAQLALLDAEQKNLTDDDRLNGKGADIPARRAAIEGDMSRTAASDQWRVLQTTVVGGTITALDEFMATVTDASKVVENVFMKSFDRTNEGLIDDLTQRHRRGSASVWGPVGHDIFKNVAGDGLKSTEGQLMKMTGLDKLLGGKKAPTGGPGDPLNVRIVSGLPGAGGAGIAAQNILTGGFSKGASDGAPAWVNAAASVIGIPHFATGVENFPGGLADVGEFGKERVLLPPGANVYPHGKGPSIGGGGDTHNWNIDARGAGDPAAVKMAVRQGIMEAAPHLVRASVSAIDNRRARTPGSRG